MDTARTGGAILRAASPRMPSGRRTRRAGSPCSAAVRCPSRTALRSQLRNAVREGQRTAAEQGLPALLVRRPEGILGLAARRIAPPVRAVSIPFGDVHLVRVRLPWLPHAV